MEGHPLSEFTREIQAACSSSGRCASGEDAVGFFKTFPGFSIMKHWHDRKN